jgi:hypothetical protein
MATKTKLSDQFELVERYETGLPKLYRFGSLEFRWCDWVLCKIAWEPGNIPHWCIASAFRIGKGYATCTIMNPSYDASGSGKEGSQIDTLHYFEPVRVIEEVREYPE